MNHIILNKIVSFLHTPEKLLSCSKKFTIKRVRNIRWENRIYFKDNKIKKINCMKKRLDFIYFKEQWYKNGKYHMDDINSKNGFTLPAIICYNGLIVWFKDEKKHRDDIDLSTGLTLPAVITNKSKSWCKNGLSYGDDIDPDTGLTLPCYIFDNSSKRWCKNGKLHRDDIDPEYGTILPSVINYHIEQICWYKNEKLHRDEIDPDTGIILPAEIQDNRVKRFLKDGIEFSS
jgi:hypothetical protein